MATSLKSATRIGLGAPAALAALAWLAGCSDRVPGPAEQRERLAVVLSDPAGGSATTTERGAYVSLSPGTVPGGARVVIRHLGTRREVIGAVVDGGLDPVPVPASAGDSLELIVTDRSGATLYRARVVVPPARPPKVVRTVPPKDKTDVPVNGRMMVVLSEPLAGAALAPSAVQLLRGASPVPGTVRSLDGVTATLVFEPAAPLAPNTAYRLVVTEAVRDLQGDALEAGLSQEFTTGTTVVGRAYTVTVLPDTSAVAIGSSVQLTAAARDTNGVAITGRPVVWTSESPAVATVSSTGLVTARAAGMARVRAEIDGRTGLAVIDVAASLAPVHTVELLPPSPTVLVGGLAGLTAVLRDSAGNVLRLRPVTWETSAPGVATVSGGSGGTAIVTGVAAGTATITATSEGKRGTATITVGNTLSFARITASLDHTCGLTTGGEVWCWGKNLAGALGNGTTLSTSVPTPVAGGLPFSQIAAGVRETAGCALTPEGAAYCWGSNMSGDLGIGSATGPERCENVPCSRTPVPVSGGLRFREIATGMGASCALTPGGAAYCWGSNTVGMLGIGTTTGPEVCESEAASSHACSMTPVPVAGGLTFTAITVGSSHACALAADGDAYCWGWNGTGQLGDGSRTSRLTPTRVAGGIAFAALSAGQSGTCGLTPNGTAYCWGFTFPSQNEEAADLVPRPVAGGLGWASISVGIHSACGVTSGGAAYCWDGDGGTPTPVPGGLAFASVSRGDGHACGVTVGGVAYCWGRNWIGQLGDGSKVDSSVPVRVAGQP